MDGGVDGGVEDGWRGKCVAMWMFGGMIWLRGTLLIIDSCPNSLGPQTLMSVQLALISVHTRASIVSAPTSASVPPGTLSRVSSSAKVPTPSFSCHIIYSHIHNVIEWSDTHSNV